MADLPRYPDTEDDTSIGLDRGSTTGTLRWVYVVWICAGIALVLLLVVLHLTGVVGPHGH
jgi:4-hydroxybenzoate polyprenyltransferase